jgi:hypothetical protein
LRTGTFFNLRRFTGAFSCPNPPPPPSPSGRHTELGIIRTLNAARSTVRH